MWWNTIHGTSSWERGNKKLANPERKSLGKKAWPNKADNNLISNQAHMVHKPRGTICFLNVNWSNFAVPMSRNQMTFSGTWNENIT